MTRKYTREDQIKVFWSKVDKSGGPDACWIWTVTVDKSGYGRMKAGGREYRTHRFSWEITNGPIPPGLQVLHNCPDRDNPLCVNPAHLWLGTDVENMKDRKKKGHYATGDQHPLRRHPENAVRGEQHSKTTLTTQQVLEIRQRSTGKWGEQMQFARKYGVGHSTIVRILQRKVWKHI